MRKFAWLCNFYWDLVVFFFALFNLEIEEMENCISTLQKTVNRQKTHQKFQ